MLSFALAALLVVPTINPPGLVARIGTPAFRQCGHIIGISPDGRRLYSTGHSWPLFLQDRGVVTITDTITGRNLRSYPTLAFGETAAVFEFVRGELRMLVRDPHTEKVRLRVVDPDIGLVVRQSKAWDVPKGGNTWGLGLELFGGGHAIFRDGKSIRLLDPETGKLTAFDPPLSHEERIADTSSDGRVCVVNLKDGGIRLYDLPSGKRRIDFPKIGKNCGAHGFTPDGRAVAVWVGEEEQGASLELLDLDGKFIRLLLENQGGGAGTWVVFDPTGKTFACRNSNRDFAEDVCEIRELATGRRIARIPDRTQGDPSYCYSPDGKTLWDCGFPPVPIDVATGKLRPIAPDPPGRIAPFQFRTDGWVIGVAGEAVFMWNPQTGQTTHHPKPPSLTWQQGCSFDTSGERLRCHSPRGSEWEWNFRDEPRRVQLAERELETPDGEGWMYNEWLHLKREKGELLLRVLPGGKPGDRPRPAEWRVPDKEEYAQPILAPGGKTLVVGATPGPGVGNNSPEYTFALIDLTDPKSAPVVGTRQRGSGWHGASPAFSRDGRWMAFVNPERWEPHRPECVVVYDLKSRGKVAEIDASPNRSTDCVFSSDGRTLAVGGYAETVLVETATWKVRATIRPPRDMGGAGSTVCWSPNGKLLATSTGDGRIAVWNVARSAPPFVGTLDEAWDALARPDAAVAFAAMRHLAENPEPALRLIRSKPEPRGLRAVRAVEAVEWMRVWDAYRVLEVWALSFWNRDLAREAWFAFLRVQEPL